ncbi:hypothetical protein RND81_06G014500 [Saponaria officinalis]|uniref:Uncharacterized protein n=1 Tax=Saponaria officinalis TaxID=3572 RepID=A0AAW1K5T7_SAPOF
MNATKFLHTQLLTPPPLPKPVSNTRHRNSKITNCIKDDDGAPPDGVEIRFRRGTRRRQKEQNMIITNDELNNNKKKPIKSWEEMNMNEKVIELYMGEKGALYWLNKFAYASIFIIIGAWILFRFVGPAFNLYQLDSPPLAPESLFKG